jgi:MoaA/NifB/PqqE/SkfB family radical SAM enzyme
MMTVKTADKIYHFLQEYKIECINVMGGEFFCNPKWKEIIHRLSVWRDSVRLVTNSDWAASALDVIHFLQEHPNVYMAISVDEFHDNKNVSKAMKILEGNELPFVRDIIPRHEVVPVGRGENYYGGFFTLFGCYCKNPNRVCQSMMIDEKGNIYKCPFGLWVVGNIDEGGCMERLKHFNRQFNKAMIMSCSQCLRVSRQVDDGKR